LGFNVGKGIKNGIEKLDSIEDQIYYTDMNLVEASWIATIQINKGSFNQDIYSIGITSISKSGRYRKTAIDDHIHLKAIELYQLGHRDMIDNLLYSTSIQKNMRFLTVDKELRSFIKSAGLKNNLIFPKDL
jgi:hypothetical protein